MKNSVQVFMAMALAVSVFSSCKKDMYSELQSQEDNVIETLPAIQSAITTEVSADCGGYYEALPARYDSSAKKYPLILFIHGIGELGNGSSDLKNMVRTGLPRLLNKKTFPADFIQDDKHFSFIVISPQFKKRPTNDEANEVLLYMLKKYRVDTSRIYVTGLSMGGGVTWEFSSKYGAKFAAIVPICGGSWPDPKRAESIASFDLPVWAFHNDDDKTVPVSYTKDYVTKINSFNPSVLARVTTWTSGGHDSWTKAYDPAYRENGKNMYEWMLQYNRKTSK